MAIERIDSVYDIEALAAEQAKYLELLKESRNALIDLNKIRITAKGIDLSGYTKATQELEAAIKKTKAANEKAIVVSKQLSDAKKKQVQVENEVIKQITLEDKAEQQNIKTKKERITYEDALQKQKAKGTSQAVAEAKIAAQLTDEYAMLSKSLKEQEVRYKNLALTQGFESAAAKEALQTALDTRAVLDKLDGNLRNYQRNVGNYKSAFDGLGMSFTQVARELPSLTISTQQFLLAISNNLPMVFDEISKAKTEIAALRAQGEETPGLFDRISKSIFSTQVVLSILVTLLTLLGPKLIEFIGGLFNSEAAAKKLRDATEELIESQQKLIKVSKELADIYNLSISDPDRLEKELALSQALNRSKGDLLKLEEKILEKKSLAANVKFFETGGFTTEAANRQKLLEDQIAYEQAVNSLNRELDIRLTNPNYSTTSAYGFGDDDSVKAQQENVDILKKRLDRSKEALEDQQKINKNMFDTQKDFEVKQAEIKRYGEEQRLLRSVESAKIEAQERINANERIFADERNFEEKKTAALRAEAEDRKKIIDQDLRTITQDPSNKNADGSETAEYKNAVQKAKADRLKIEEDLAVDIFNLQEEFRKRRLAAELEANQLALNDAAKYSKDIFDSDVFTLDERLAAFTSYLTNQRQAILNDYEYQKATKILTDEEKIALEKTTNSKLRALTIEAQKELSNIIVTNANEQQAKLEALANLRVAKEEFANAQRIKNKEKLTEENAALEYNTNRSILLSAIEKDQAILDSAETTAEAKYNAEKDLTEKLTALYKLDTANYLSKEEKKRQALLKTIDIIFDASKAFYTTLFGLMDAQTEKQKNAIQEQIEAVEKKKTSELKANDASTESAEKKAANVILINARAQAQREELEMRQKELDRQKAKRDKLATIFSIILSTAQAIAKQIATTPLPAGAGFVAAIAAMGAAQLAVAIATPIPKYKGGRGFGKEELSITGDGGVSEYIVRESGAIEKTPAVETLTHLMPKDRVYKNEAEMMKMFSIKTIPNINLSRPAGISKADMQQMTGEIRDAVEGISIHSTVLRNGDLRAYHMKLTAYNEWISKYIIN